MRFDDLIASITPEIYDRLKRAVELGKWDNGVKLTSEQLQQSLQAIIAYDAKHTEESGRVGYIEPKQHSSCAKPEDDEWQALKIHE